jgi:hypothetical protein
MNGMVNIMQDKKIMEKFPFKFETRKVCEVNIYEVLTQWDDNFYILQMDQNNFTLNKQNSIYSEAITIEWEIKVSENQASEIIDRMGLSKIVKPDSNIITWRR